MEYATIQYPAGEQVPPLAFFHPLALFNCNSLFYRFRSARDHLQIWDQYFGLMRYCQTGERMEWMTPDLQERINRLKDEEKGLHEAPPSSDDLDESPMPVIAIDPTDPEKADNRGWVSISPRRFMFERGELGFYGRGFPAQSPIYVAFVDRRALQRMACEIPGLPGIERAAESAIRHVFSDERMQNDPDIARIVADLPSCTCMTTPGGSLNTNAKIPHGDYFFWGDTRMVVAYDNGRWGRPPEEAEPDYHPATELPSQRSRANKRRVDPYVG